MPFFGKRKAPTAGLDPATMPRPKPDADGFTRVFPKELLDDPKLGPMLKTLGFDPDAPSNIVKSREHHQAIADRIEEERKNFVAGWNKQLPREVIPWALIPYECWKGPHAGFLLGTLEMYPGQPYNMILLPKDDAGAFVLELPKHPGGYHPSLVEGVNNVLGEIRQMVLAKHHEALAASARGDFSLTMGFSDVLAKARQDVEKLAAYCGAQVIGEAAYFKSRELFFAGLKRA